MFLVKLVRMLHNSGTFNTDMYMMTYQIVPSDAPISVPEDNINFDKLLAYGKQEEEELLPEEDAIGNLNS